MVVGCSYAEMREWMGGDFDRGMTHYEWFEALARLGFAVQFIFQREQKLGNAERQQWPLAPWAPAHIVQVGNHYVVLLLDGTVLDPALPAELRRPLSDYEPKRIYSMAGIFPVSASPISAINPAPAGSPAPTE